MTGAARVSKRRWYELGGFRNSACFRRQRPGRGWEYFVSLEHGFS